MKKYLLTIEFRYSDAPKFEDDMASRNKIVTIGVFDDYDTAAIEGNKALEVFEKYYKLHTFPNGRTATKKRFSKNGGCFGSEKNLISPLAYLRTNFDFYAKIETLHYFDIEETIKEVNECTKRYINYKRKQD